MRSLRQMGAALDRQMEHFLLKTRSASEHGNEKTWGWLALASLPFVAALKYFTGPHNPLDLFVLALVFCCLVFRHYGFFATALALALDLVVKALEISRLGRPDLWPKFLLDTAFHLVEWLVVCSFVIITLEKWAALQLIRQRTDEDLALAKSLQSSLTRKKLDLKNVKIRGAIHQCDSVGGDFYYFRPLDQNKVSFCLGDVMGKGISASLLMAMVMSFVYEWGKQCYHPADIAARLNRRLSRLWDGRRGWFITIFYGILDEESGVLEYCAAGQQGGFLLRGGKLQELISECDPPLGVVDHYDFTSHRVTLQPDDRVLLYTDGVYEAKSKEGELFGTERLGELFTNLAGQFDDDVLLKKLETAVLQHTGGVYTDDTTLFYLHYKASTRASGIFQ